jgi:hypothetical protein
MQRKICRINWNALYGDQIAHPTCPANLMQRTDALPRACWLISSLKIIVPGPDATVHDNNGKLTVMVESTPPIGDDGDTVSLTLDDAEVEKRQRTNIRINRHCARRP